MNVKALSLTRPWTELVLSGVKDVENRRWGTSYRGLLVVHGAKSWDAYAREMFDDLVGPEVEDGDRYCPRDKAAAPTGYLGVVTVTDVHRTDSIVCRPDRAIEGWCALCSPWAFDGQWHWHITGACRFPEPIPGPGRLGLFEPPSTVQAAALALREAVTAGESTRRHPDPAERLRAPR